MTTLREVLAAPELAAMTYPEAAAWLAARPLVENPVKAAPMVPAPITLKAIMAQVPAAEMAKVYGLAGFVGDLRTAIADDDREYMGVLLAIALAAGAISAGTAAKLQPLLTAQVSDPSWSAQIPGAPRWQAAGLAGAPTAADVQAACHG
jgi:hypothetical protein